MDTENRVRNLETETALIKRDLCQFGTLFAKLDITIDKITNLANDTNKLLAVQEQRIDSLHIADKAIEGKFDKAKDDLTVVANKIESMNMYLIGEITNTEVNLKRELKEIREEFEKKISKELETQASDIEKLTDKINHLERWKWMVIGFAIVAGWVIERVPVLVDIGSKAGG